MRSVAWLLLVAGPAYAEIPEVGAAAQYAPVAVADAGPPVRYVSSPVRGTEASELEQTLLARRQEQIDRLHAYAVAGVFPRNVDEPGFAHQFLDKDGRPCAMAYLIQQSGHADLVAKTAKTKNHVVLGDVHSGPLYDWMLESGLTQEEIAVIQEPSYMMDDLPNSEPIEQERLVAHFLAVESMLRADTQRAVDTAVQRLVAHQSAS